MKELEDSLGVRLFERKTRALDLTTAGHTLLDEVEPLLEALDRSWRRSRGATADIRCGVAAPVSPASCSFLD